MKDARILLIAAGTLLVGLSVFLLGWQAFADQQVFYGSAIGTPAPPAMEFELQRPDGASFRLEDQRGKVVLIFFGYTNCQDVCPATLGKYQQIAAGLGEDASEVAFVFITVDPDRDTSEAIGAYMNHFNPDFVGLSGPLEELQRVWVGYGAGTPVHEEVDGEIGYEVSHSTRVWVIDKQGNLRITFPFEMTASDMAHDVDLLLAE
ncbi:MAG TPA: SCO family protein [Anaerolineales bacterium]|nr:SCO family protein [Anaerolineales bacterium]HLE73105.1 SCO family protein [Anaerolineales bacterium]